MEVSSPLIELATQRAVQWACSKPHAPLLIQIASSASGGVLQPILLNHPYHLCSSCRGCDPNLPVSVCFAS